MSDDGPRVFVGEDSPAIRSMLADKLEAAGAHVHFRDSGMDSESTTSFMGNFACALLALERPDGKGDTIDEAELLRMYQPTLPVAFLHDDVPERLLQRARAVGPVFRKPHQLEAATAWVVANSK
jgi:CheY-like chemotaxis protein